ncbi:copper homeostasis protein CutC [Tropicimonas sp. IMCC34043]|uniref:copper homeostasis protein CutC n=1 Tax=Tropicimonas sp. IMCC34043 TaxID=2248760 RepID=UPI000E23642C|nr:copper homeostasis protein CutC [Tropicimonas sp. IMCC34043]
MITKTGLSPSGHQAAASVTLEVCVGGANDATAAVTAGADRLELCVALEIGGLTPSPGLMQAAAWLPCPVIALIRPRAGDFTYSAAEIEVMRGDIAAARSAGLAGVAIGALTGEGRLDLQAMAPLRDAASGMELVLHRAFDLAADPFAALDEAIAFGFDRILTSGQAATAAEGAALIGRLVAAAGERITILPGAGLSAETAPALLAATGAREVHASCSAPAAAATGPLAAFGFAPAGGIRTTDPDRIRALRAAIDIKRKTEA